ncbi:MAG: hypothetical protein BAJALOKI3v1_50008 [Promethearchaeota archaeon]|nr:MAG: hypothetical protein BAJALOKI3v1_50008 [Candidatus Lokiarchaeota archaeon]
MKITKLAICERSGPTKSYKVFIYNNARFFYLCSNLRFYCDNFLALNTDRTHQQLNFNSYREAIGVLKSVMGLKLIKILDGDFYKRFLIKNENVLERYVSTKVY